MLVRLFSQVGLGLVSFFNFFFFWIMCVMYLITLSEKDSIGLS